MDYQEYCETFLGEDELVDTISSLMDIDGVDVTDRVIECIDHFVMVQHYATLPSLGFFYKGACGEGVLFEWRNEPAERFAGVKLYRAGCVVEDDKYTVREYPDPLSEEYNEIVFDNAAKAVIKILECVGCDFIQEGLADIPEPKHLEDIEENDIYHGVVNLSDLNPDFDLSDEDYERECRSRTDKTVDKLRKKMKDRFDKNELKKTLGRVRKLIYEIHSSWLGEAIGPVTEKDGSVRIRCYDDFEICHVDIYTKVGQKDDTFSINVVTNDHTQKLVSTDGKTRLVTDDIDRIVDIVRECRYGGL